MTKIVTDENKINEFLNSRYIEAVFPSKEKAGEIMGSGERLVFYWGIDPTGSDVHLGHTTNPLLLKKIIELGHKIILLIGNFTAMIGDPTGKDTTRKVLNAEEVKLNMKTYLEQIQKILPKGTFEVKYNADWYRKMIVEEFIKLADFVTVQQMIAREMFQKRLKEDKPISLREFLYPVLQGYDSVAMDVDGEMGGNDQTFNMLVGRDLLRKLKGKEKIVITTRLLEDSVTGKKLMNKSEGQYISLNDSADDMFGKIMAMPDSAILPLFSYTTEIADEKVNEIKSRLEGGENPIVAKKELAIELVKTYYNEKSAQKAKENFERVFSEGKLPEEMKEFKVDGAMTIVNVLQGSGMVTSASEAKRLIDQKAIEMNGKTVMDWGTQVETGSIIKIGSHRFLKIK